MESVAFEVFEALLFIGTDVGVKSISGQRQEEQNMCLCKK